MPSAPRRALPEPPAGKRKLTKVPIDKRQADALEVETQRDVLLTKAVHKRASKMQREMSDIRINLPMWKKAILFSKVAAVAFVAVGLEALTTWQDPLLALVFFGVGALIVIVPVRVSVPESAE